jgi:toxin FitB
MTLGEIRNGIELLRSRDPIQAEVFANWLGELRTRFAERIVPIDVAVAEEWGRLNATMPRNTVDGLIAASARPRSHRCDAQYRRLRRLRRGADRPLAAPA